MNVDTITSRLIEAVRLVRGKVDVMVARAIVELVNDSLKTQRLQLTILADEPADGVEHFQPYGLSFVPPVGAEAIALALGGSRAATVAICAQVPDERPTADGPRTGGLYTNGEWRVFIDDEGHVHLAAQVGPAKLARADRTDAEFQRIWTLLGATWAPAGTLADGTKLAGLAATEVAQVQSTAADKVHGE